MQRDDWFLRKLGVRALWSLAAATLFWPAAGMARESAVEKVRPAAVKVVVTDREDRPISSGTGFFISSDGEVITSAHIIRLDAKVWIETESGATFQVESFPAIDTVNNLALLKVRGRRLPSLELARQGELRDGMPLLIVPFATEDVSPVRGNLQLTHGREEFEPRIPLKAEFPASAAGAPVCDEEGRVLGVASLTMTGNEQKSFVIPVLHIHTLKTRPQATAVLPASPQESSQESPSGSESLPGGESSSGSEFPPGREFPRGRGFPPHRGFPNPGAPLPPDSGATLSSKEFAAHSVIIQGDKSSGSGFIAMYQGKPHLFTNNHVISGNSRISALLLDGTPLKLSNLWVDGEYDLAIFGQEGGAKGLEILENVDQNVEVGDTVLVVGNSMGSRVVTDLRGTVQGVGPGLVEVNAPFVSGNSGSPVIHVRTGKVIGIATYVEVKSLDGFGKNSRFNKAERRFAYRLDNPSKLEAMDWNRFTRETSALAQMRDRTEQVWELIRDIQKNGRITKWNVYIRDSSHLSMTIGAWQKDLAQGKSAGILIAKKRLLSGIIMTLQADHGLLNPNLAHAYARKEYENIIKERKALIGYFRSLEEQLSNDPNFITQ